jgi:rhamnose transport system permease protein
VDYLVAGSHQVPLAGLPEGFTNPARDAVFGMPIFVIVTVVVVVIVSVALRSTRFGRQLYAVGSNPEAADVLGIPSRLVVFVAFSACGLLAGVAGVMFVMEFGTINGTSATGLSLAVVAAVVVGGVNIFGGTGSVVGAMLGALFLGFIANALILVGLSQFWLQAIYGAVILVAVSADAVIVRRLKRANSRNAAR